MKSFAPVQAMRVAAPPRWPAVTAENPPIRARWQMPPAGHPP
ncbi:MAG: hypothetical protein ACYDC1_24300 [Limisphaerales bacterium]